MKAKKIPYFEWVDYVKVSTQRGKKCQEFNILMNTFPDFNMDKYQDYAKNELIKLEMKLIKDSILSFQKTVNKSMSETDVYIFEKGVKTLKKDIVNCLFFDNIDCFSNSIKNDLRKSVKKNYMLFLDEFINYLRKAYCYDYSSYIDDINYVFKRANIKKFIQEHTDYE
jgi:hypothetical protein